MKNLKVHRFPNEGVTYINVSAFDKKRLNIFIEYTLNVKNYEGIVEIYDYIYKNIVNPEWYLVQYLNNEFIVQKLGTKN